MSDKLKEIYQHCFEMLKLAETKNAGLIAFNGAVIVGILKLVKDFQSHIWISYYLYFVILVCSISVIIGLTSLVAQLRHKESDLLLTKSDNLLFFGTIAHLTPNELLEKIRIKYKIESSNESYELDIAKQAIIMSQIAVKKYKYFNTAILWTFAGIATPLSILYFKIFNDPNKI